MKIGKLPFWSNNMITYNWDADSDDAWTVPLGLEVGKMLALKGGHGLEFTLGGYHNAARPDGAADWVLKWGIAGCCRSSFGNAS